MVEMNTIINHDLSVISLAGREKMRYTDLLEMILKMLGNNIRIDILPSDRSAHYQLTPYNSSRKMGMKMTNNPHVDMRQSLLQCIAEIFEKTHSEKAAELGIFVNNNNRSVRS